MMNELERALMVKFKEIERRILLSLDQLNDEQLNWRPNASSNSIANLIVHICGNIGERIRKGINLQAFTRNRDQEFETLFHTKHELATMTKESFRELLSTLEGLTDDRWLQTQKVRNKERTNLDMLIQCAAHFSEHMGQILYIAKMLLGDDYTTTSIPKRGNQVHYQEMFPEHVGKLGEIDRK